MFKCWVLGGGESSYATNGLEFETIGEAKAYGDNLLSRWFGAEHFVILPVSGEYSGFVPQDIAVQNAVASY